MVLAYIENTQQKYCRANGKAVEAKKAIISKQRTSTGNTGLKLTQKFTRSQWQEMKHTQNSGSNP